VNDLAAQVAAALDRSVLPSVIARGGTIRVTGAGTDGIVTLEIAGSPGAALPLASRIEASIRAAVPTVTAIRLIAPGGSPPGLPAGADADLAEAARQVIDAEVNPAIAAHHGHVTVTSADGGWIRIRLELWTRATSLGGVESLIEHRASVEGAYSAAPPDLLRLSVGIEAVADLIADLEQALA